MFSFHKFKNVTHKKIKSYWFLYISTEINKTFIEIEQIYWLGWNNNNAQVS
jgi:hypothetical protein